MVKPWIKNGYSADLSNHLLFRSSWRLQSWRWRDRKWRRGGDLWRGPGCHLRRIILRWVRQSLNRYEAWACNKLLNKATTVLESKKTLVVTVISLQWHARRERTHQETAVWTARVEPTPTRRVRQSARPAVRDSALSTLAPPQSLFVSVCGSLISILYLGSTRH